MALFFVDHEASKKHSVNITAKTRVFRSLRYLPNPSRKRAWLLQNAD